LEETKSPTPNGAEAGLRADLGQQLARGGASELLPKSVRPDQPAPTSIARENDLAKRSRGRAGGTAVPALNLAADEKAVNARGGIPVAVCISQPTKETQEVLSRNQQQIGPVSY